jgi:hypothetical protein
MLNLDLMAHPLNWLTVLLMVTIPLVALKHLHDANGKKS